MEHRANVNRRGLWYMWVSLSADAHLYRLQELYRIRNTLRDSRTTVDMGRLRWMNDMFNSYREQDSEMARRRYSREMYRRVIWDLDTDAQDEEWGWMN